MLFIIEEIADSMTRWGIAAAVLGLLAFMVWCVIRIRARGVSAYSTPEEAQALSSSVAKESEPEDKTTSAAKEPGDTEGQSANIRVPGMVFKAYQPVETQPSKDDPQASPLRLSDDASSG